MRWNLDPDLLTIIQQSRLVGKADVHRMHAEAEGSLDVAAEFDRAAHERTEAYLAAAQRIQDRLDQLEELLSKTKKDVWEALHPDPEENK